MSADWKNFLCAEFSFNFAIPEKLKICRKSIWLGEIFVIQLLKNGIFA